MTDMEQLVEQAKIGDRQSLNTLYSRFRQRALSICCHITRDKELSEELADDAKPRHLYFSLGGGRQTYLSYY